MPDQPKTKGRMFRIPDDEYDAARRAAAARGETLTDVVRRALAAYVRRTERQSWPRSEKNLGRSV